MSNPSVTALSDEIKQLLKSAYKINELTKTLLGNTDQRGYLHQLKNELGASFDNAIHVLENDLSKAVDQLKAFADVHYYLDIESRQGKGEWRELVKRDANYRISIPAVTSLREHAGVDLVTSRRIIEAYKNGQFE